MIPKRLTVKFFIQDPESLSLDDIIPIFHHWIRDKTVEGLLIDVADYKHIQDGPGLILLGDLVDYAIDLNGGRPGLLLRRKRQGALEIPLQAQLLDALLLALRACHILEIEPALQGRITFRTDEVEIGFPDRLHTPNTAETWAEYSTDIRKVLGQLYPGSESELQPISDDSREVYAVSAWVPQAPGLEILIANLEAAWVAVRAGMSTGQGNPFRRRSP